MSNNIHDYVSVYIFIAIRECKYTKVTAVNQSDGDEEALKV